MERIIFVQPYYKIERKLTGAAQETVVHHRLLHLYETRITSAYREFPLHEVYDMSYKSVGGEYGILYLHTKRGVYPFTVAADPTDLIKEFKKITMK